MHSTVCKLSPNDIDKFKQLLKVFEDEFDMDPFPVPDDSYLQSLLLNPAMIIMTAEVEHQVVGGLSAYVLAQYYSRGKHVYIHDMAVSKAYQRKGIGKNLIALLKAYCESMGYEEIFAAAEKADTHALEFYRSAGATSLESVHFFYNLRSGEQ
jgi:aminoglycoside 3-N-acetyltransferase I